MNNGSDTKEIIRKAIKGIKLSKEEEEIILRLASSVHGKRGVIARKKKYGKDWAKIFYSKAPTHLKAKKQGKSS